MRIEEVAIPKLGDGEALVQVKSALNSSGIEDAATSCAIHDRKVCAE